MWDYLKTISKPILLYGMGNGADKILNELTKRQIKVSGVFANDTFVRGQSFAGLKVLTYQQAKEQFKDFIVLLCFGTHDQSVIERIKFIASEQELYAPDVPVVGDGLFDKEYYEKNIKSFNYVRNKFADEKSKFVFDSIINYRLSGKLDFLFECEEEMISFVSNNEIYLDLGAYTGDTIKSFIDEAKTYRKIIAVEPESRNFRKLKENTADLENIELFSLGISDKREEALFSHAKGRGGLTGTGRPITLDSIDNILDGKEVTYIKIDTEGQELKAILGGENTIKNYKPKMEIAAYHRVEDLLSIPSTVLNINPNYKLYIRHSACLPGWEVNYYFL